MVRTTRMINFNKANDLIEPGHDDVCQYLIQIGSDLSTISRHQQTPLQAALAKGIKGLSFKYCENNWLNSGQRSSVKNKIQVANVIFDEGCKKGYNHIQLVKDVINVGGDDAHDFLQALVAKKAATASWLATPHEGMTVFGYLCQSCPELAKSVLDKLSPEAKTTVVNAGSPSPLWQAVYRGHHEIVQLLLDVPGCNIDAEAPDGTSPLLLGLIRGQTKCVAQFKAKMSQKDFIIQHLTLAVDPKVDIPRHLAKEAVISESFDFMSTLAISSEDLRSQLKHLLESYWSITDPRLLQMSKTYPKVSDEIEEWTPMLVEIQDRIKKNGQIDLNDLDRLSLRDFCKVKALKANLQANYLNVSAFKAIDEACPKDCQQ